MPTPRDWYQKVSNELGLENSMDWGIVNADGERVLEFIEYINAKEELPQFIRYGFVELVYCSMNDLLIKRKGVVEHNLKIKFDEYLESVLFDEKYYPHSTYWISSRQDNFVLGEYFRAYAGGRDILS